jgi:WS/DGAT/MGAT family acyltransferase
MNGTDAALWDIERDPLLRTTVVSILLLDQVIDPDRFVTALETAVESIPRLRQRVHSATLGLGVPTWVVAEDFDIGDHFRVVTVTPRGGRRSRASSTAVPPEVLDQVREFAEEPFDRELPLWEAAYLAPLAAGRSALVFKMHHSLADGIGGVALLDALLDISREGDRAPVRRRTSRRATHKAQSDDAGLLAPFRQAAKVGERIAHLAADAVAHPTQVAGSVLAASSSAVRLMAPSGPPLSALFVDRSVERRPGVHTLEFERLHRAASRHGCTVNHLFLAGVIGGVAAYHRRAGVAVEELRVTMPVSIRKRDSATAGNQWAPARLRVPADIEDPVERMRAISAITTISQHEPALNLGNELAAVVQMLPSRFSSGIVASMMRGVDLTVTNVPGLADTRFLAGAQVERIYGFAPTGGAAMSIALLSHDGLACFGMLSDSVAVADATGLHKAVVAGLDAVVEAAEAREPTVESTDDTTTQDTTTLERLTALDTSFLHLETPTTPMHLGGIFTIDGEALRLPDGRIDVVGIRDHVRDRLDRTPSLKRRLVEVPLGLGRPVWAADPDFDVEHHVRFTTVEAPGTAVELAHLCAQLNAERLDRSRPLWEIWIIDGLATGDVGLLHKVHHALADGVSSVELVSALFDTGPNGTKPAPGRLAAHAATEAHLPSRLGLLATAWSEQLTEPLDLLRRTAAIVTDSPGRLVRGVEELAGELAGEVGRVVGSDRIVRSSPLNRPIGRRREIASVTLPFDQIAEIRSAFEGSANDVALSVIAGGLGEWFASQGDEVTDLRAACPVSVRQSEVHPTGGNRVGAMMITLPVTEPDPVRRLALVTERTLDAKQHHEGHSVAHVLDAFDHLPDVAGPLLRSIVANQPFVNLVITNVPGPPVPLWFAGAQTRSIVPMVPLGPNTALGVALLSYVDDLTIGFHTDPDHMRDVHVLVSAVEREFDRLRDAANQTRTTKTRTRKSGTTKAGTTAKRPASSPTTTARRRRPPA